MLFQSCAVFLPPPQPLDSNVLPPHHGHLQGMSRRPGPCGMSNVQPLALGQQDAACAMLTPPPPRASMSAPPSSSNATSAKLPCFALSYRAQLGSAAAAHLAAMVTQPVTCSGDKLISPGSASAPQARGVWGAYGTLVRSRGHPGAMPRPALAFLFVISLLGVVEPFPHVRGFLESSSLEGQRRFGWLKGAPRAPVALAAGPCLAMVVIRHPPSGLPR